MRTVVALCGLPGSGKSTLARALAQATGWTRLDRDSLRRELLYGYSDADKARLAEILCARMKEIVATGNSAILDGMTFSRYRERETFAHAVRESGAHWLLAWVECDVATARERVAADTDHPAADRCIALVDHVAARFEIPEDALRVDSMLPVTVQLDCVLEEIRVHAERGE